MKKAALAVLIIMAVLFLIYPSTSEARRGYRGGNWGWWGPSAVVGGAVLMAPFYGRYYGPYYPPYYPPYYSPYYPSYVYEPYYAAPPLAIPAQVPASSQTAPPASISEEKIFVYPRQGQTETQQADDRYECHRWSVGQTGFDPTQPPGNMTGVPLNQKRGDYNRALSACLDGRGYTVK
ncbi:MAG TPA: hypothetical protein DCG53_06730 [Syntrophus sp. (in: bacteria)]|nr:hypothetical protein [Syntrophus sp. (in: bacteria)]